MNVTKQPYNVSPYEDMKRINVPWLEDMTKMVKARIAEVESLLVADAERNGVPGLANEDEMYARFLDNKGCRMNFANLEVFKYFVLMFRIKMYYELIGQWRFTERDVEMYNYYMNDFSCGRSAYARSFMYYESDRTVLNLNGFISSKYTSLYREFDGSEEFSLMYSVGDDLYRTAYLNLFTEKSHIWNLLVQKVKGLAVDGSKSNFLSDLNYFDSSNFYDTTHAGLRHYSEMNLLDSNDVPDVAELRRKRGLNIKKKFYENNKESVKESRKDYRNTHKEQIKESKRKDYEANRERYCEHKRQYNQENKEVIAAKRRLRYAEHKEEDSIRCKKYREAHKEELAQKNKAYREANKEELARKKKIYIENNREVVAARQHKYYINHKEEFAIKKKANYEANRDAILAQKKEYYEANKEELAQKHKDYHDKLKSAGYRYRKDPADGKRKWIYVGTELNQGVDNA